MTSQKCNKRSNLCNSQPRDSAMHLFVCVMLAQRVYVETVCSLQASPSSIRRALHILPDLCWICVISRKSFRDHSPDDVKGCLERGVIWAFIISMKGMLYWSVSFHKKLITNIFRQKALEKVNLKKKNRVIVYGFMKIMLKRPAPQLWYISINKNYQQQKDALKLLNQNLNDSIPKWKKITHPTVPADGTFLC